MASYKAKIQPVFTTEQPHRCRPLRLTDRWEDDYGSGDRYKSDYWHARRAFLSSYKLSSGGQNDDGFKEKMERWLTEFNGATLVDFQEKVKRKLKEFNGVSTDVMAGLWKGICKKKSSSRRMGRIRLGLPSGARPFSGGFDCLAPWWVKLQLKAAAAGPY